MFALPLLLLLLLHSLLLLLPPLLPFLFLFLLLLLLLLLLLRLIPFTLFILILIPSFYLLRRRFRPACILPLIITHRHERTIIHNELGHTVQTYYNFSC